MNWMELAEWMGRSTVLIGAIALVLFFVGKRLQASARFSVWLMVFFAVIGSWLARDHLPKFEVLPFQRGVIEPVIDEQEDATRIPMLGELPISLEALGAIDALEGTISSETSPQAISPWLYVWAAGGLILLLRVVISFGFLARPRREFPETHPAYASLRVLAQELGIRRTIRLVEKSGSPMTWGVSRVVISLPHDCDSWSDESLDLALRHELAHVKRADVLWLFLTQVALSLFWFHPGLWWISNRLRLEREKAADEAVLQQGVASEDYADVVLMFSRFRRALLEPVALCGMASPGRVRIVEDRVRNILTNRSDVDEGMKRGITVALALSLAVFSGLVFCAEGQKSVVPKSPTVLPGVDVESRGEKGSGDESAVEKPEFENTDQEKRVITVPNPENQIVAANPAGPVQMADAFDYPVGGPNGEGYHVSRGFTPNSSLGEDWNGNGGGNTDLGDPVKSIANGYVVYADNFKKGWGNVVIVRHTYLSNGGVPRQIDSVYGMLNRLDVKPGEVVTRGQQVGTIGRGPHNMYAAHLHFELRKNINILMDRASYAKDYSNYYSPRDFIKANRN